ncbi:MAG: hypothetical protein U0L79_02305 [Lachnospiraceae bacterium]|nr:hypothetical protein [Lachnospiraceae bacterium]
MPKRGNWGDWAVIDFPKLAVKKASCLTCIHYIEEDGSCAKTPIIPRIDGKERWKKMQAFSIVTRIHELFY